MIKTKRGLDLPINGSPKQTIEDGPRIRQVALVGYDYPGMKPTMEVREGDQVKAGQLIFT
ncbi:MAG: NADH:ubiquinone reductase (Na(+)-transporting) subunit A, partial [Gammaproteobacteria bacterium]|nr:NADH:ubiquinone reductase (Na(+)-transporting) subunit A [Gammaproteobacteria bacterium]